MNRHFKAFLLVLGGVLLVAGSGIFAVGCKGIKTAGLTREFDLSDKEFTNFNIELATSDLEFVLTTDSTKKIVYKETEKYFHTEEVKDSTLFIKQTNSLKWYERVFSFDFSRKKATIYYPATEFNEITVKNSTGDIKIPHDFSFNKLDIKVSTGSVCLNCNVLNESKIITSTGDVSLNNIATKSLYVEQSTGELKMKDVNVTEEVRIVNSTGDASLENVRSDSLNIKSSNGKISLEDVKTTNDMILTTSTGDIRFNDIDFKHGEFKASTGDVKGSILTPKFIKGKTSTGKKSYEVVSASEDLIVTTSTGDIIITFK